MLSLWADSGAVPQSSVLSGCRPCSFLCWCFGCFFFWAGMRASLYGDPSPLSWCGAGVLSWAGSPGFFVVFWLSFVLCCVCGLFGPPLLVFCFLSGCLFCFSPSSPFLQPSLLWFCRRACFVCAWALRLQGPCTSGSPLRVEKYSCLCWLLRYLCC